MTRHFLVPCVLAAMLPCCAADAPRGLELLAGNYPSAFFFRAAEGMAANERISYEDWERNMSRLQGIQGKVLDEEVPGRSRRNIEFFTRFKKQHPSQLVLLHYNGNARDPRDDIQEYFAGHWIYYNGCRLTEDLPAQEGDSELHVENAALFRANMGRYGDRNEDIGLCMLDDDGKPDWSRSEQVQLIAADREKNTITVKRGCFGTTPRAFPAGSSYAAAHATEGPWGERSNLMWFYNYSTACPKAPDGRTCTEVLVEEFASEFDPGGRLESFDGVEFDVMSFHRGYGGGGRGLDTDADGEMDHGIIGGVNEYGVGVYDFCRRLRERVGEGLLLLADGHGPQHQRSFGQLNGIESEGWPALSDCEVQDWSGGLNRHLYWREFARRPVFNYFNHKFIEGREGVLPDIPFSRHRLVLAAAQFVDAAVTYSFAPPREKGGLFPIWDELRKGEDAQLGWLGKPRGSARRLGAETPDLLAGAGEKWTEDLIKRFAGRGIEFRLDGDALRVQATDLEATDLRFKLRRLACEGPDLLVLTRMRAACRDGYPEDIPRLTWVGVAPPGEQLVRPDDPPKAGYAWRGKDEADIDPDTGADCRYMRERDAGGDKRDAYMCHPPWRGGKGGYTFWERDVQLPEDAVLQFAISMGELSPERSDGVVFKVLVRSGQDAWATAYEKLFNEFRWQDESVSLAKWSGQAATLRFVTDAGPNDNSTTDHSSWADVRVTAADQADTSFAPDRHMTFTGTRAFESSFAFGGLPGGTVDIEFTLEGREPAWIEGLSVHSAPDAMVREFDNGVVLANPSRHSYAFELGELFPGRRFTRIKGTGAQDQEANSGQPVGERITLGERDGLFLAAQ